jgi:heat shock protein HslJ
MNLTVGRRACGTLLLAALLGATGCGGHSTAAQPDVPWGRTFVSTAVTENGQPQPLAEGTRIRIAFDAERRALSAHAGCNRMFGKARLEGGRLVVDGLASTKMGCPEDRARQDDWLGTFLESRPGWRLKGHELTLTRGSTRITLTDRR